MRTRLADLDTVLGQTQKHKLTLLKSAATTLRRNYIKIRKMKSVYFILNQFSLREGQRVLIGRITCVNYKTSTANHRGGLAAHQRHLEREGCPAGVGGALRVSDSADHGADPHHGAAPHLPPHQQVHRRLPGGQQLAHIPITPAAVLYRAWWTPTA